jgi:hypothetical protein
LEKEIRKMIVKLQNEQSGLIELRFLEGSSNNWGPTTSKEYIDLDTSGLNYGGEIDKWLDLLKDQGRVMYPVNFTDREDRPKVVEGDADYVIVPHSIGDGGGPYLIPILAVRTFDGSFYADLAPHCT